MLAVLVIGAALPALQPLDNELLLAINSLGDGPEWVYQTFDPHGRNYAVLALTAALASALLVRRARYAVGTAIAVVLAGLLADAAWELVKLFIERDRPEEVLGTQVALSHDRTWAHIGSYPSGHLLVTTAMAAAAAAAVRALRGPLLAYVGAVALTRLLFGAHFPIDVLVGAAFGHQVGLFATTLSASARLLPQRQARRASGKSCERSVKSHKGLRF
jgi:membrane-associated phospholipid phosphatase